MENIKELHVHLSVNHYECFKVTKAFLAPQNQLNLLGYVGESRQV